MTKKLAFNPLSGLFWCRPWVRAILPCGCEMANPFAPRSPITMTSQRCAGQDRKDFLSATAIDSENVFCCGLFARGNLFAESVKVSFEARETRVNIPRNRTQPDTQRICDYRIDAINWRLVIFYFATRVKVTPPLITDRVYPIIRKKHVFCHICITLIYRILVLFFLILCFFRRVLIYIASENL